MDKLKFQCSKCGACCKRAGWLGLMPTREDGACLYLNEDNSCSIYETRPEVCRVESMWEIRKSELTKKEYFKRNNHFCNEWIKEDGLGKEFLIDISKYDDMT